MIINLLFTAEVKRVLVITFLTFLTNFSGALEDFGKNKELAAQQKAPTQQAVGAAGGACAASEV